MRRPPPFAPVGHRPSRRAQLTSMLDEPDQPSPTHLTTTLTRLIIPPQSSTSVSRWHVLSASTPTIKHPWTPPAPGPRFYSKKNELRNG